MDNGNLKNPNQPGATKLRIIAFLRRGLRTVPEIAAEIGLSSNAVRTHLATLERDRLIAARGQRSTARRPATLYALTPHADHLLAKKPYAMVLSAILQRMKDRYGDGEVTSQLRNIGQQLAQERAERVEGLEDRALVDEITAIINDLGGSADVEAGAPGHFTLMGHSCPLAAVVSDHAEACAVAEAMIETLLGQGQVQTCCERGEEIRCRFAIALD